MNPPLRVFDEPTSALDAETEKLIKDSFRKLAGDKTTFIIAHRLSLIDIAHRILSLEKGTLREKEGQSTKVP